MPFRAMRKRGTERNAARSSQAQAQVERRGRGFLVTMALGIGGSFLATFIGQSIGWYRHDQGAGLIGATLGAIVVLILWIGWWCSGSFRTQAFLAPICRRPGTDAKQGVHHGPSRCPEWNAKRPARRARARPGRHVQNTMALLAFLAYKAYKGMTSAQPAPADGPSRYPTSPQRSDDEPGGLAGVLRTIFGGGSLPGPVVRRGVDNTVRDLEGRGHGDIARSWISRGPNQPITPQKLESALGEDAIKDLMQQTGMERDELLAALSEHLPRVIDHLTPEGRLPSDAEARRMA